MKEFWNIKTVYPMLKTSDLEIGGFMRRQLAVTVSKGTVELKPIEVVEALVIKNVK